MYLAVEIIIMKRFVVPSLCLSLFTPTPSFASLDANDWDNFSDISTLALLGFTFAKPLYDVDNWMDTKTSWHGINQAAQSIGFSAAAGVLGRKLVDEIRQEESNNTLPSYHATTAFAAATHLHIRHGWEYGFPAYAIAGLISYGRVESTENKWFDVIAGAAIGSATAWFFTESKNSKVRLTPWADRKNVGFSLFYQW